MVKSALGNAFGPRLVSLETLILDRKSFLIADEVEEECLLLLLPRLAWALPYNPTSLGHIMVSSLMHPVYPGNMHPRQTHV